MTKNRPKPPRGLTSEGRALWNRTLQNWPLGQEETLLTMLRSACGALQRLRSAEAALARLSRNGVFLDRWHQPRLHPLHAIVRDSAKQLREDLRALSLDWEALNRGKDEVDDPRYELSEPEEN